MHSKSIHLAFIACSSLLIVSTTFATGPTPPPTPTVPPIIGPKPGVNPGELIPVVIEYGQGKETRAQIYRSVMDPVGVLPDQSVTVTLLLGANKAGNPVTVGLYDGGQIGAAALPGTPITALNNRLAAADGTVQFNFQAGRTLGLYRLLVTVGAGQYLLQFYAGRPGAASPLPTPPHLPTPQPTAPPY